MFGRIAASPSLTLLAVAGSFAAAVGLHAFDERSWGVGPAAIACAVLAAGAAAFVRGPRRLACLILAASLAGIVRYEAALAAAAPFVPPPRGEAAFVGTVVLGAEPGAKDTVLVMDRVFFTSRSGERGSVAGRVEVRSPLPLAGDPGDIVSWRCRAKAAAGRDAGTFLADGIAWRCTARDGVLRTGRTGRVLARTAYRLRAGVRALAAQAFQEPESSLLLGILVGERRGLPQDLRDAFRDSGAAHILAVSGYNVTVLVGALFTALGLAGLRRRPSAACSALLVCAYAAVVGAEASVVRAAVMGCAGLAAAITGRRYDAAIALTVAAAAMLAVDPTAIRHDLGFRLSFSAMAGLHALAGPLSAALRRVPDVLGLRRLCAENLAATVGTFPVVIHDLGTLPLAGLAVNMVVVPLVPLIMAGGCLALAATAASAWFGAAAAAVVTVPLRVMEAAVTHAARLAPPVAIEAGLPEAVLAAAAIAVAAAACRRPERVPYAV